MRVVYRPSFAGSNVDNSLLNLCEDNTSLERSNEPPPLVGSPWLTSFSRRDHGLHHRPKRLRLHPDPPATGRGRLPPGGPAAARPPNGRAARQESAGEGE